MPCHSRISSSILMLRECNIIKIRRRMRCIKTAEAVACGRERRGTRARARLGGCIPISFSWNRIFGSSRYLHSLALHRLPRTHGRQVKRGLTSLGIFKKRGKKGDARRGAGAGGACWMTTTTQNLARPTPSPSGRQRPPTPGRPGARLQYGPSPIV